MKRHPDKPTLDRFCFHFNAIWCYSSLIDRCPQHELSITPSVITLMTLAAAPDRTNLRSIDFQLLCGRRVLRSWDESLLYYNWMNSATLSITTTMYVCLLLYSAIVGTKCRRRRSRLRRQRADNNVPAIYRQFWRESSLENWDYTFVYCKFTRSQQAIRWDVVAV